MGVIKSQKFSATMQTKLTGIGLLVILNTACLITCQSDRSGPLSYVVTEGEQSLQFSADIRTDSGIISSMSPQALNNLHFKIASPSQGGNNAQRFVVDEDEGYLTTNGPLDRDAICPGMSRCTMALDISALSPPDFFQLIKINITIPDINDNSPRFNSNFSSIQIPETSPVGFRFPIPRATDIDSPQFGIQGYRVIDNPVELSLDVTIDSQGNIHPFIQLEHSLDRETTSSYDLDIEVFDSTQASIANVAKLSLHIDVLDANDNAPYFEQEIYRREIPENFNVSDVIIQVHALDHDHGDNAALSYRFDPSTRIRHGSQFHLDEISGDITLIAALDYETQQSIDLIITATEKNPNNIPATATVLLSIRDINDNIPVISVESISGSTGAIEISENTGAGAFLAHVSVLDKDSGPSGEVICVLHELEEAINVFTLEYLLDQNYKLTTKVNLDAEERTQYMIEVRCSDNGSPQLSSTYAATVTVLDQNDHTPVLQQSQFTVVLEENNEIGVELVHLNATDPDSGRNSEVVYQVYSGPRNYINVDPYNGKVTARMSLDYEQVQMLQYQIIAFDQGSPKRTATATIRINITDQNDRAPSFVFPFYQMHVEENQITGAYVGRVEAIDDDSALYNKFLFEFLPDDIEHVTYRISETFAIDPLSGNITTKQLLDREQTRQYLLSVRAFDKLNPMLFSIVNVTVIVVDTNDHTPRIIFPNSKNNTLDFNPDSHKNSVTRITAVDRDSGQNALLSYTILSGNDDDVFYLDETSGILFVQNLEKLTLKPRYSLNILVKDNGIISLSNETWLHINIVEDSAFLPSNTIILTIIGIVSGIIIVVLIIAIVLLKRRYSKASKHHKGEQPRPNLHYTLQQSNNGGAQIATDSPVLEPKRGQHGGISGGHVVPGMTITPWEETVDGLSTASCGSDIQIRGYHHTSLPKGQQPYQAVYACDDNVSVTSAEDSGRGSSQMFPQPPQSVHGDEHGKRMQRAPDLLETTWRDPENSRIYPGGMSSFRSTPSQNPTAKIAPRLRYTNEPPKQSPPRVVKDGAKAYNDQIPMKDGHSFYTDPTKYSYSTFGKIDTDISCVDIDKNKLKSPNMNNHYSTQGKIMESGC